MRVTHPGDTAEENSIAHKQETRELLDKSETKRDLLCGTSCQPAKVIRGVHSDGVNVSMRKDHKCRSNILQLFRLIEPFCF